LIVTKQPKDPPQALGRKRWEGLIDMLSTNLEPVKGGQLWKALSRAIVIGLMAAFSVILVRFGIRNDLAAGNHSGALVLKTVSR
jgi:hypothetical protein